VKNQGKPGMLSRSISREKLWLTNSFLRNNTFERK